MKIILRRIEQILQRFFEFKEKQMLQEQAALQPDEWLDSLQVMELLNISPRTFYRLAKVSNWITKQIGARKYYLKSSILASQ
ncbi:hypothetical protein SAMN05421820_11582 [Pedobacter steynii]|uniref:Helix-turn-helix domain-containing protein n=1 Tax=Pedobacter steynii TaxID=430522 RepID=A0A1H0JV23_9SPHI|nr:hypothetical protein SAMN05421820_11582 [Pedobacter steynii]